MRGFCHAFILLILILGNCLLMGQSVYVGEPYSVHFSPEEYQGGRQSWDFAQDRWGRIFVANNIGLLVFNGSEWQKLRLPNRTIVRSVKVGPDQRVFVGGQGIFGYFDQPGSGAWEFHDLSDQLPEPDRQFADVWEITLRGESVFFRTASSVIRFRDEKVEVIARTEESFALACIRDTLWLHTFDEGLLYLVGDTFQKPASRPTLSGVEVVEIFPLPEGGMLLVTLKSGLFRWEKNRLAPFATQPANSFASTQIQAGALLKNGHIALGTLNHGIMVLETGGQVLYQKLGDQGQRSNVRSLFCDRAGNLWAGLESGVELIHTRSPFRYLRPDGDRESPAYAVRIFRDHLYVGLGSGLFRARWKPYDEPGLGMGFEMIPGTVGQVWGLDVIQDQLLLGHHEGAFQVQGTRLVDLAGPGGVWCFEPPSGVQDSLVAGHYTGLALYHKKQGQWRYLRSLEGFEESSRFVESDSPGVFWVSHPYRGVYRIEHLLDSAIHYRLYGQEQGLPSGNLNHIFSINNEVLVAGERGVFRYEPTRDRFEEDQAFARVFDPQERVIRLFSGPENTIWYVTDQSTGFLKITDRGLERDLEKTDFPEIHGKLVAGFEEIYPHDAHNVFFASARGVIHLDPERILPPDSGWSVCLEAVYMLPGDTLGRFNSAEKASFPREVQGLRFACAAPIYSPAGPPLYRYRLEGLDDDWSPWTVQRTKEYNNLPSGSFTLRVEAKAPSGVKKQINPFRFSIAPPWYASRWALAVYAFLVLAGLLALILLPQRAFRKEKAYLETVHKRKEASHKRELQQTEEALQQLEHEKLENEVRHKTQELASTTMHLVQKNQLMIKLKGELEDLSKRAKSDEVARDLRKLIRLLKADIKLDDDWEQFSHHFDQVHRDFVSRLIKAYPQLTPNDHRMCAYLRMNLSSKEIAPLMNISVRGVEVSRYRLRKKLGLASETNLTEFMMRF